MLGVIKLPYGQPEKPWNCGICIRQWASHVDVNGVQILHPHSVGKVTVAYSPFDLRLREEPAMEKMSLCISPLRPDLWLAGPGSKVGLGGLVWLVRVNISSHWRCDTNLGIWQM
jgi:hypothetical protein